MLGFDVMGFSVMTIIRNLAGLIVGMRQNPVTANPGGRVHTIPRSWLHACFESYHKSGFPALPDQTRSSNLAIFF